MLFLVWYVQKCKVALNPPQTLALDTFALEIQPSNGTFESCAAIHAVIARTALDADLGRLAEVKSKALDSRSRLVRLVWSLALALFFDEGSRGVGESDENGRSTAKLRMTAAKLVVTRP